MGRRNPAETLVQIIDAFHEKDTWTQARLAALLGVEPRTVRAQLELLVGTKCFPLERRKRGAQIEWKLPPGWRSGGLFITDGDDLAALARLVARAPKTATRERLLARILACMPPRMARPVDPEHVATPERGEWEERMLVHCDAGLAQRRALSVRYFTAKRGEETQRCLSIQHIDAGPPARLVAYCHTAKELRTFRVDGIRGAVLDPGVPYVRVPERELATYLAHMVAGFHGAAREPTLCRFLVRPEEAGWVERNLLTGMTAKRVDGGLEVTAFTTGIERVASFVAGLGGAAVISTPELRQEVRKLAEAALLAIEAAPL